MKGGKITLLNPRPTNQQNVTLGKIWRVREDISRNSTREVGPEEPYVPVCPGCGHLIFDQGGTNMQWRKAISSIIGAGKTGQVYVKE